MKVTKNEFKYTLCFNYGGWQISKVDPSTTTQALFNWMGSQPLLKCSATYMKTKGLLSEVNCCSVYWMHNHYTCTSRHLKHYLLNHFWFYEGAGRRKGLQNVHQKKKNNNNPPTCLLSKDIDTTQELGKYLNTVILMYHQHSREIKTSLGETLKNCIPLPYGFNALSSECGLRLEPQIKDEAGLRIQ